MVTQVCFAKVNITHSSTFWAEDNGAHRDCSWFGGATAYDDGRIRPSVGSCPVKCVKSSSQQSNDINRTAQNKAMRCEGVRIGCDSIFQKRWRRSYAGLGRIRWRGTVGLLASLLQHSWRVADGCVLMALVWICTDQSGCLRSFYSLVVPGHADKVGILQVHSVDGNTHVLSLVALIALTHMDGAFDSVAPQRLLSGSVVSGLEIWWRPLTAPEGGNE